MAKGSIQRLRILQRAAFEWSIQQGFNVAALDVSVSQIAARLDVAAFKMDAPRRVRGQMVMKPGPVAIFECKADREDFLRDTRSEEKLRERLRELNQQREAVEERLRQAFPTLREGLTLFPEYDVYRFREVGGEEYGQWLEEIEDLTQQLYSRGRFSRMLGWRGANLSYVMAEEGVAFPDELPLNWGLVERRSSGLQVLVKAVWQEVSEMNRWVMATKIAAAAASSLGEHLAAAQKRASKSRPSSSTQRSNRRSAKRESE